MRIAFIASLSAAFVLAACQTPCPPVDSGPIDVVFTCADGSELAVTFTRAPDSARVVQEGYAPLNLPARITGSSYRYGQGGAELRGRGAQARWARPGAAETLCREGASSATPQSSQPTTRR